LPYRSRCSARDRPAPAGDGLGPLVRYDDVVPQLHIDLPETVSERVTQEATRRGVDPVDLVTEAVTTYLGGRPKLGIIGLGASGRSDISERVDEEVAAALRR
jgi:hypothetical protein